ncbi:MAG: ribulose-phosphate 3-epimerase [Saccharofermentans sp.]|nr:ribulose-phosphate 3-epimerase [Saccharofermentans sp.]
MSSLEKKELAPSVLAADFAYLMKDIDAVSGDCKFLHLDVMDGHYVPNISIGVPIVASIRKHTDMIFDTHLMILNPGDYIKDFADAGSDYITFHIECTTNAVSLISEIRALGKKAGVAIHPDTPIEAIFPYLEKGAADLILVMTVRPGFGGQTFIRESLSRIATCRERLDKNGSDAILSVDGGINTKTIVAASEAGADLFVTGSAVFGQEDKTEAAKTLFRALGQDV